MNVPPLHNLGLCPPCAPTGVYVAPGAEPEKGDKCGICLESLADHIGGSQAPGEALRPAAPTWVRVCANNHAFHKVCIRTFLLKSPANRYCPECRQPVLRVNQLLRIPDGFGTKTVDDGVYNYVFDGQWQNGEANGHGTMTGLRGGGSYVGQWQDSLQHGQGTLRRADGDVYEGTWHAGQRNGQGTRTYPNGDVYVGAWQDGERGGQGTYTYADGSKYVGAFQDGKRSGQGTATYHNGATYVGAFQDGVKNGKGTYTFADGRVYVGEWQDGMPKGSGTWTFPNGDGG